MGTTDVSLSVELVRAETLRAVGRTEEATAVLDAVERSLVALGHSPTSQLGREIARIRGM
jgi:hypothetical protein